MPLQGRGLQKVRHYGFLPSGSKTYYELLSWIVTLSLNMIYVLTFKQQTSAIKQRPKCQNALQNSAVASSAGWESELPSVRLGRTEAPIGSYLETPLVSSSPLALCQRKPVKADTLNNVSSAGINRTESDERSVALCVAANYGPAGMKPAETFLLLSLLNPRPMLLRLRHRRI